MRSFFAIDREETLYNEIALHIMTVFPQLKRDALSDILENTSIKQFDEKKSKCLLALLCEDINEKNNQISLSDFNTIIGEYAALFENFNQNSFEKISKNFNNNNSYQFVHDLINSILDTIGDTNCNSLLLNLYDFVKNINLSKHYEKSDSSFMKERIEAIRITKEVYGHILENREKYNQLKNDYQSQALLAVYNVLKNDDIVLLKKVLIHAQNISQENDTICNILNLFSRQIKSKLNSEKSQKEIIISFCIKENIDKKNILNILFDEEGKKELNDIREYEMPKNFLELEIEKAKKKYSNEQIVFHLKDCVFDFTIDNIDAFVIKLETILKEYCHLQKIDDILNIFFKKDLSCDIIFTFLSKIAKSSFQKKIIIQEYLIEKYSLINSHQELILEKYPEIIPVLWDQLLFNGSENKIKEFLLLLKSKKKFEDKYCVEFIKKFPLQNKEFIKELLDKNKEKYKAVVKNLLNISDEYPIKDITAHVENIKEQENLYSKLLAELQEVKEVSEHILHAKSLDIKYCKYALRSLYELYVNNFLYEYYLQTIDDKSSQVMHYVPFAEITLGTFKILLNQDININYLFKYVLLSEGDHRGPLIRKFLGCIPCTKKCDFSKMIAEGVQSHADIDSIIQYCNECYYFPSFIEALPKILIDSYCESIKKKSTITSNQNYFLFLASLFRPEYHEKNKLADIKASLFSHLRPNHLFLIPPNLLMCLSGDQLANIPAELFMCLSGDLLANIPAESFKSLSRNQLEYIPAESFKKLSGIQLEQIPAASFKKLSGRQLERIPAESFKQLSGRQLEHIPAESFNGLRGDQLEQIPAESFKQLSGRQLEHIPAESFKGLSGGQLAQIPVELIQSISGDQLRYIPAESFKNITVDQLVQLPAKLFGSLSDHQLQNIHNDVFEEIVIDQLENIVDQVFKKINNDKIMIIKKKISYLNKRNLLCNVPVSTLLGITAGLFVKKISYLETQPREILLGIFLSSASISYLLHQKNTKNIRKKLNFLP